MANTNFREYLKADMVRIKKYFYVLRPVLAARWIEAFHEFPPIEFQTLLEKVVPDGELKKEINVLLERKLRGDELDMEPRINLINSFLEQELKRLLEYAQKVSKEIEDPTPQLDILFRNTLNEVWKS